MPRPLIFCVLVAFSLNTFAKWPFPLEPQRDRSIVIDEGRGADWVKDGVVGFEIVVGKNASSAARFAGSEMKEQLSQAFGADVPVVSENTERPSIILGDVELAAKHGIVVEELDRDGFVIKSLGQDILIVGKDDSNKLVLNNVTRTQHATLFGAYDFLERFAGIRYYFPTKIGTVIPKATNWRVPYVDIYDRPDLITRKYSLGSGTNGVQPVMYEGMSLDDWRKQGVALTHLRARHGNVDLYVCHTLRDLGYRQRFEKSHPEYFSLGADGKRVIGFDQFHDRTHLCFSSGIKDVIIGDAVAFFKGEDGLSRGVCNWKGKPGWYGALKRLQDAGEPFFSLSPNDGLVPCHCENPVCQAFLKGTPQERSNIMWQFFADVARSAKAAGGNGIFTAPVYSMWRNVPQVELPDNLRVEISVRGPWNEKNPAELATDKAAVQAWFKKNGEKFMQVWTYPGKYQFNGIFPGIPATTPRAAGSFTKWIAPYTTGIYFESCSDYLIFSFPVIYVYGKMMWNVNADAEALVTEMCQKMFGPAAKEMEEFLTLVEDKWMAIASHCIDTPIGPVTSYPSDLTIWSEIYSPKVMDGIRTLFDKGEKLCKKDAESLERVRFMRKNFFGPLEKAAAIYQDTRLSAENWCQFFPEAGRAPVIDGKLDDEAWVKTNGFYLGPRKGKAASVTTVVKAMRDKDYYYFAFDCQEPLTPQAVQAPFDSKDLWRNDEIEIYLSPDGDRSHYYQIMMTCMGGMADLEAIGGKRGDIHWEWNSNAEFKTDIQPGKGWTAEIRVPLAGMRTAAKNGVLADFTRQRHTKENGYDCSFCWSPTIRTFGDVERFGTLLFEPEEEGLIPAGLFALDKMNSKFPKNATLDTQYFVDGGASLRLDGAPAFVRIPLDIKPDTDYVLSFYLKMKDVKREKLNHSGFFTRLFLGDKAIRYPAYGRELEGTLDWTYMVHRFRSFSASSKDNPPYGKPANILLEIRQASGQAWIDHVQLTVDK